MTFPFSTVENKKFSNYKRSERLARNPCLNGATESVGAKLSNRVILPL